MLFSRIPSRPRRRRGVIVAIGFAAVCGSLQARELPRRKADQPKAADAACAYLGEGYTRAPGSDTCIRVSGHVRADASVIWGR